MSIFYKKLISFCVASAIAVCFISVINLLIGCAINPPIPVPQEAKENRINACLPNAIMLCEGLRKAEIQSRVLSIFTGNSGHAVCVYLYPKGANKLWVWDADWGSIQVIAYYDNPEQIARGWMRNKGDYSSLIKAEFRDW